MLRLNALLSVLVLVPEFGIGAEAIPNWPAPATWSPPSESRGVSSMDAVTSPLPFIAVTPCRVADTRGNGFAGQYGPPTLAANAARDFTITGQCGIPVSAVAVSCNFAALNVAAPGDLRVFPAGSSTPLASTMNYDGNSANIANAAIAALGTGGAITVLPDNASIDLIIDVNGYYGPAGAGAFNTFLGLNAGSLTTTGANNTAVGYNALASNTIGVGNAAFGHNVLFNNTDGGSNTAVGDSALFYNNGGGNTAVGDGALFHNIGGSDNAAIGQSALRTNTAGSLNTASGSFALYSNVDGERNTAIGGHALYNSTGSENIGIGVNAGSDLATGNSNICIGNPGVATDVGTIRIGTEGTHGQMSLGGVRYRPADITAVPVLIGADGTLGTISSSARLKDAIRDMGDTTERLLRLRPVTFFYKANTDRRIQFGLIAEEVEKVMPELVVCSSSGEAETVLYHEMPAMLLNELQKQQREIQRLKSEISALQSAVGAK